MLIVKQLKGIKLEGQQVHADQSKFDEVLLKKQYQLNMKQEVKKIDDINLDIDPVKFELAQERVRDRAEK